MSSQPLFSIRSFLRSQEALLVHFNTPMSTNHPTCFPADLEDAKTLVGKRLSFCTIQKNDRGPCQVDHPANANAAGSVGLVVDVNDTGSVVTVDWSDSGSGQAGSAGLPPDQTNCAASIAKRTTSNEWWVQDYKPLGIFVFRPAMVFVKREGGQGESHVDVPQILKAYPSDRIFSTEQGSFLEFNRPTGQWAPVTYGQIVPP
jgi:hypothetical protein